MTGFSIRPIVFYQYECTMKVNQLLKLVLIAGIVLRIVLWCFQSNPSGDDGQRYLTEGLNMVRYGVFSTQYEVADGEIPLPSAHDMPLWPGIMAVVYWITDSVRATQYIAGAINIGLVLVGALFLVALLKGKPFRLQEQNIMIALAVYLFMPESVIYSLFHMPDQLAVTSIIVALYCYFKGLDGNWKFLFGAFFMFLTAIYSKPICIPLSFALIVAMPSIMTCPVKKRIAALVLGFAVLAIGLYPWVLRNKCAFGTSGLNSIAGTNLYSCNWGWMVNQFPADRMATEQMEMKEFESKIFGFDLMKRSKLQGKYAKEKLLTHFPDYVLFTIKQHPRLYVGTGSVAMFRYLGAERLSNALVTMFASDKSTDKEVFNEKPYTPTEKFICGAVQILSWLILLSGYLLVAIGIVKGSRDVVRKFKSSDCNFSAILIFFCPVLCLVLLALIIGPIATTRYRLIMLPFFSVLAAYAYSGPQEKVKATHLEDN